MHSQARLIGFITLLSITEKIGFFVYYWEPFECVLFAFAGLRRLEYMVYTDPPMHLSAAHLLGAVNLSGAN